jgi:prepilin-type N-terminal cleavage/methylation domain-containing protein
LSLLKRLVKKQRGYSLVEVLVAMVIISITFAGLLGTMSQVTRGALKTSQIDTARTLAQSQMEYVKRQMYSTTYAPNPSVYDSVHNQFIEHPGYSATIAVATAAERNANIQKISVTIAYQGTTVATLDDCRVK